MRTTIHTTASDGIIRVEIRGLQRGSRVLVYETRPARRKSGPRRKRGGRRRRFAFRHPEGVQVKVGGDE